MHFAYPPRKSSNPPPFRARSSKIPYLRRSRLKIIAVVGLVIVALVYLLSRQSRNGKAPPPQHKASGHPPAVIVTALDENTFKKEYIESIKDNRRQYAQIHGYETYFPRVRQYDLRGAPQSWTKVVAMRDALTKYPEGTFFWYLDQDSFIMNPEITIQNHLMNPATIELNMIRDHPVVPPDSIIKTFAHLKGEDVDLMITQDKVGLCIGSFILRNSEWARFFLETWFDPIYRTYNFQKAEAHALEHIVQWHPTILSKLALVPQRMINSYNKDEVGSKYEQGDIAVRFPTCAKLGPRECEMNAAEFTQQWQDAFKAFRGS